MDREAWRAAVHGVAKSRTRLSDWTELNWPAYRFLRRQIRWSGIPISLRIFQFVLTHTVKGFSVVNEVDVFLEFPCFLYDQWLHRVGFSWGKKKIEATNHTVFLWSWASQPVCLLSAFQIQLIFALYKSPGLLAALSRMCKKKYQFIPFYC